MLAGISTARLRVGLSGDTEEAAELPSSTTQAPADLMPPGKPSSGNTGEVEYGIVDSTPFSITSKPQSVRLTDVFVVGPLLLYVAFQKKPLSSAMRFSLFSTGLGTILYNWHNYQQEERRLDMLAQIEIAKAATK